MDIIEKKGTILLQGGVYKLMQRISSKGIIVWRVRFYLLFIVLSFIFGGLGIFNIKLSIVFVMICVILAVVAIIFYCPLRYERTRYYINNEKIKIKQNVIFCVDYSISIKKIQYIQMVQTPLQRVLHLCSIIFHTAGSTIKLEQIPIEEGIKIRNITYK